MYLVLFVYIISGFNNINFKINLTEHISSGKHKYNLLSKQILIT